MDWQSAIADLTFVGSSSKFIVRGSTVSNKWFVVISNSYNYWLDS